MLKIGICGLGNIGGEVFRLLTNKNFLKELPSSIKIIKVCDINKTIKKRLKIPNEIFTTDFRELILSKETDVIVELIGGKDTAFKLIKGAIKNKKHVVTANKFLLAFKGEELFKQASKNKVNIGFEASVCGGVPVIKILKSSLNSDEIQELKGIINGTTNFILSMMESESVEFEDALKIAQKKGIAEKDPSLDITGKDSLHKLCILNFLCFGIWIHPKDIYCEGIQKISLLDIMYAKELGYSIKLLAISRIKKGNLFTYVAPSLIPLDHPLAKVSQDFNALFFKTKLRGDLLFYGKGAGPLPTAGSVISDILEIKDSENIFLRKKQNKKIKLGDVDSLQTRFYIRFIAEDIPGVLAKISSILAKYKISIASVTQKERNPTKYVPIIMLTHYATPKAVFKALKEIDKLKVIKPSSVCIRIED